MKDLRLKSNNLCRCLLMLFIIFFGIITITASGGGGGDGTENSDTDNDDNGNGGGDINTMQFTTYSYVDEDVIGLEAFSMIIPEEWDFGGGIEWGFDNPGAPAVASFTVSEPDGLAELELLPAQSFYSTQNPGILGVFPVGSEYYGNEVIVWPPLGPLDTLEDIIIPRFRGTVTNLQIISKEESLEDIVDLLREGMPPTDDTTIDAAKIRIEYEQDGVLMEEEIYCVIETLTYQNYNPFDLFDPNLYENSLWMADFLFSFKAEKGELDSHYKIFQTMMYSFRLNPQWYNKYVQLIDYLVGKELEEIEIWGQISQIISQTSDEISDIVWQSYNNRNAASDRMAEDFSNYILGTETYYNPIGDTTVKLPSGYSDAWANALGEYILSDNVNYDPNISSGQTWERLVAQ